MAMDVETGPFITMGNASYPTNANGTPVNNIEDIDPEAGPNLSYQGEGILDPRYFVTKDSSQNRQGSILSTLNSPYVLSCDRSPQTASTTNIAAAQAATSGTGLTLAGASAGISTGVPFFPFKSSVLTTAPIALDFGFMGSTVNAAVETLSINGTATATASSALAASNFYVGQWLIMPNAGATATSTLITQVTAISGTSITLSPAPGQTSTIAAVGSANIPNGTWIGNPTPVAAQPYLAGGVGGFLNPKEAICRAVAVTANAGATGGVVQIKGWDLYGQPQTENITAVAASTVNGKKTWKYIQSATPQFTDAGHTYAVGTLDIFGFAVRSDRWEYANIFWNGTFATSSAGWTAADLTSPATTTTGDVRGTYTAQGGASDGIKRLALFTTLPLYNVISATPANPTPLYGVFPV